MFDGQTLLYFTGTLLTIRGRMFTDQIMETEDFDPNMPTIERIYAGASLCEIKDPGTEQLYGIKIEDNVAKTGYIKCKPASTVIGSQRPSFLVSGYGLASNCTVADLPAIQLQKY